MTPVRHRGEWDASERYAKGDIVTLADATFLALEDVFAWPPSGASREWALIGRAHSATPPPPVGAVTKTAGAFMPLHPSVLAAASAPPAIPDPPAKDLVEIAVAWALTDPKDTVGMTLLRDKAEKGGFRLPSALDELRRPGGALASSRPPERRQTAVATKVRGESIAVTMARAAMRGLRADRSNFIRDQDYYGYCILRAAFAPYRTALAIGRAEVRAFRDIGRFVSLAAWVLFVACGGGSLRWDMNRTARSGARFERSVCLSDLEWERYCALVAAYAPYRAIRAWARGKK